MPEAKQATTVTIPVSLLHQLFGAITLKGIAEDELVGPIMGEIVNAATYFCDHTNTSNLETGLVFCLDCIQVVSPEVFERKRSQ